MNSHVLVYPQAKCCRYFSAAFLVKIVPQKRNLTIVRGLEAPGILIYGIAIRAITKSRVGINAAGAFINKFDRRLI